MNDMSELIADGVGRIGDGLDLQVVLVTTVEPDGDKPACVAEIVPQRMR